MNDISTQACCLAIEATRVFLIKEIDEDTPYRVILEIAESMGYKVDYIINYKKYIDCFIQVIEDYMNNPDRKTLLVDLKTNHPVREPRNLADAAKLINSDDHYWDINSLNLAMNHLVTFDPEKIDKDFKIGKKTPENPLNYDMSMLYKICKHYNLKTCRGSTIKDLGKMVKYRTYSYEQLVDRLMRGKNKRKNETLDQLCYDFFQIDTRNLFIKRFLPMTDQEAITIILFEYGINIYYAKKPLKEYHHIKKNFKNIESYVPSDNRLLRIFNRDKRWIFSNEMWIPQLINSYSPMAIIKLAENEGFSDEDLLDSKVSLLSLDTSTHIYLGIHPFYDKTNLETFTIFNIENAEDQNIENGDYLLTIGKTKHPCTLFLTTITELINHFTSVKNFLIPGDVARYYFNATAITKLKNFCKKRIDFLLENNEPILNEPVRILKNLIDDISLSEKNLNNHMEKIKKLTSEDQEHIKTYLFYIMELAFYMRGWKVDGNDEYPLVSEKTQTSPDSFDQIERNYEEQYMKINNLYSTLLTEVTDIIDSIYLLDIKRVGDKVDFVRVKNPEVGTTIMEKLIIIKENSNDNACIRLSSNYILYTVYHYYKECFGETLFDIEKVSPIS